MIVKALFAKGYGFNIRKKLVFLENEISAPDAYDVLIEVYAAGLNPVDYKIIYGMALIVNNPTRPFAVGFDLAGKVIAKGNKVVDFNIGDEVYSKVPWPQMGTVASHILVKANMVALKPKNINFNQAAGIPLVGCTVVESFDVAKIEKGTKIFINSGSGGIGTFAIQYAKYLGAYVYTTTSTNNVDWVKKLGADVVIDYKKEDYRKLISNVDVVFDVIGSINTGKGLAVVKHGGKIISVAGHHDNETLKKLDIAKFFQFLFLVKGSILMFRMWIKNVYYKHVWSYPNQKTLNHITNLIENGHIKPVIDKEFKFENAIEALTYLQKKRAKGKVIVIIKNVD